MSLNSIEFVNPESVVIKSEKTEEDIFNGNPVNSNLAPNVSNTKCGEIFTSNNSDFTLICAFCGGCYNNIPEFGEHLRQNHKNENDDFYESLWESETKVSVASFDGNDESGGVGNSQPNQAEFECKECKKLFGSQLLLKRHKCQVTYDENISGDGGTGAEKVDYKHPVNSKPPTAKLFCSFCNKQYRSPQTLQRHKCKLNKEPKQTPTVDLTPVLVDATQDPSQQVGADHSDFASSTESQDDPSSLGNTSKDPVEKNKKPPNPDLYCEICDRRFKYKNIFKKHGMRHPVAPIALQNDPDYLKCCYCSLKLANNAEWYEHENSHTEDTPFQCSYCPKRFKSRHEVEMHTNSHTGARPYKCAQCGASFAHSNNLSTHIKRVHLRLTPFSCTLCDKKFVRNVELTIHMRQHTGEKPYQCEECGRSFMIAVQLNEHRKRHTNIRDVKCPSCPMAFFTKKMLRKHMVKHSDSRPHVCAICGRTFSRKKALVVHNKIHQDIKEYVCAICGKAFAQPAGLYSHKKSHMHSMNS
ncbi:unnamed protein product [Hermetia illucens]|uniref:C2H2-type domain-containing protein n=1 Tax=Hermetia illucens TaxID=343691 RepID=A0A7R8UUG6_HERIL|nr:unnamed protein product [Hermetia illucens]